MASKLQSAMASRRREEFHEAEVVVIGAGVFGCAMAYSLAQQGRSVILLERWMSEPDRIVGEYLQPGGVLLLRKLGLAHCLEGIDAIESHGFNIMYNLVSCVTKYPSSDDQGRVVLEKELSTMSEKQKASRCIKPNFGRSFHHGRFIMNLRRACQEHPKISVFETKAIKTIQGESSSDILGVHCETTDSETGTKRPDYFFGQLTIAADGYDSKFRKQHLESKPVVKSRFYALELRDCALPAPGHGHTIIGNSLYPVLMYQIGSREVRALFSVPENCPEASVANGGVRGYIRNVAVPNMPEFIRESVLEALSDGKIPRSMPNSWLPSVKQTPRGLVVLGDALNMRHPLTGGGMTVAFNDVLTLSNLLTPERVPSLGEHSVVQAAMDKFHWERKRYTCVINVLAQALYSLFAADDRQLKALQRGCFHYFEMGVTEEPLGMVGGLIQNPMTLFSHFFTVAFVSIWLQWKSLLAKWGIASIILFPWLLIEGLLILWKACQVFVPMMIREAI